MASQTDEQQQPEGQNQRATTQLEFYQAMHDFKTMFPEMDEDVIEAVLRSNNGAVDLTIDQLLAMSTDNENEKIRGNPNDQMEVNMIPEPPSYSPGTPPPPYRQVMYSSVGNSSQSNVASPVDRKLKTLPTPTPPRRDLSSQTSVESPNQSENTPLRHIRNWKPPLLGSLPDSFLRIPTHHSRKKHRRVILSSELLKQKIQENERLRKLENAVDPELKRYLEDERVALLLQNEEFVTELRRNKDFMSTLEKDTNGKNMPSQTNSQPVEALCKFEPLPEEEEEEEAAALNPFPYTKSLPHDPESDALFKEKLKNMGKMSRRKFTQLARMFSRRKKRNSKGILGEGSTISQDNLLLDEEEELSEESPHESEEEESAAPFEPLPETGTVHPRGAGRSFRNRSNLV